MRDADEVAFGAVFLKLRKIFGLRGDQSELQYVAQSYFRALMRFPLRAIETGADAWIEKGEHFPKPAQWIACIPRMNTAPVLVMPEQDANEYRRAVGLRWEDDPCTCHECKSAGVTHRPLRYVPDYDVDDRDVRMLVDGKVVVRGHWAHGDELNRWYAARDAYFALHEKYSGKLIKRMKKPLELVGVPSGRATEEVLAAAAGRDDE